MKELLRETGIEGYDRLLEHQLDRLQGQIMRLQEMREQLKETKDFCREAVYGEGKFEVRELKPYYVREAFSEVGSSKIRNSKNFSNPLLTWGFPPALLCMEKGGCGYYDDFV